MKGLCSSLVCCTSSGVHLAGKATCVTSAFPTRAADTGPVKAPPGSASAISTGAAFSAIKVEFDHLPAYCNFDILARLLVLFLYDSIYSPLQQRRRSLEKSELCGHCCF